MIRHSLLLFTALLVFSCGKDKEEKVTEETVDTTLQFEDKHYAQKTTLPCTDRCTNVDISIPVAGNTPVVADSINKKIFGVLRQIIFFGEKPYDASNYEDLMASFIGSYEELKKKFPQDEMVPWEAKVKGTVDYKTDSIINIKVNHYTFTGGAHGYSGDRSLLFNAKTGRTLAYADIFKDQNAFKAFAEKKFRAKFKIPAGKGINATGLMFENETFALPQNIFFTKDGLLLYYNAYEIASYAEQQKELVIPYTEADAFLKMK
ncbi:MAG: DUF3298/DUF4163 domain-containing protein [Flavobacterium sp.]|nr:MAG: DUF3298/DUF4163 domain-containing protein [Flavobacterium sp.]